jgi:hypothetical protein
MMFGRFMARSFDVGVGSRTTLRHVNRIRASIQQVE